MGYDRTRLLSVMIYAKCVFDGLFCWTMNKTAKLKTSECTPYFVNRGN